jgi:replicative DNA helicase
MSIKKQQSNIIGKIPPQAIDVEEVVIGALLLERDALNIVLDILSPESFYKYEHQEIYRAMRSLSERSHPVDLITVANELRSTNLIESVGGYAYLAELTNRIGSAANIEYHSRIIEQKAILRGLIEISSKTQTEAYNEDTDVFELLENHDQAIVNLTSGAKSGVVDSISDLVPVALNEIAENANKPDGLTGIPSGFYELDKITAGWQNSDLIIVAARPGMGKTAFALNLARNSAYMDGKPVAIFSLEMAKIQVVNRLLSAEGEIPSKAMKEGKLTNEQNEKLFNCSQIVKNLPIYIDATPGLNVMDFRVKCRKLKAQKDIGLIVIDYIQLMSGNREGTKSTFNREQEISKISRSLKHLALELDVPIIALSQLSRQVEQRGGGKRPQLSDLRESGAIEQDADQVLFIHRPEYYGVEQTENGEQTTGLAEVIIAKNRSGALGTVKLFWEKNCTKFKNWEYDLVQNTVVHPITTLNKSSKANQEDYDSNYALKSKALRDSGEAAPF